jgi:hypothetical protein
VKRLPDGHASECCAGLKPRHLSRHWICRAQKARARPTRLKISKNEYFHSLYCENALRASAALEGVDDVGVGAAGKVEKGADKVGDVTKAIEKASALKPGPHAKESISGYMGKPTASEQKQINTLMDKT